MSRQIFRQEALDRLASPDRLDQLMPLTSPQGWIVLAGVGVLLLLALLWALMGSIAITVTGEGCLTRAGGVHSVTSPAFGTIAALPVVAGDEVKKGQLLARVASAGASSGSRQYEVASPVDGRLLSVRVKQGDVVEAGSMLFKLETLDRPLQVILYVPAREGYKVHVGDEVSVTVSGGKGRSSAHLAGKVKSVERFPSNRASLIRTLESEEWVDQVLKNGPVLEVVVELEDERDRDRKNLYSGTPCQGQIVIERQRPIHFVLHGGQ
jgi:multidrug resistance efflux pump